MLQKKRNVVGAEWCVLVQCLECLELTVTSVCSLMANSETGSGLASASATVTLQYR